MRAWVKIPIDKHYVAPQRGTKRGRTREGERHGTGKGEGGGERNNGKSGMGAATQQPSDRKRARRGVRGGRGDGGAHEEMQTMNTNAARCRNCCREGGGGHHVEKAVEEMGWSLASVAAAAGWRGNARTTKHGT